MTDNGDNTEVQIADAAWAHNRWPMIGFFSGAGMGLVLGVVTAAGMLWTLVYIVALTVFGCAMGFIIARMVYGSPGTPSSSDFEKQDASSPEDSS